MTVNEARQAATKLVEGDRVRIKTNFIGTITGTVNSNGCHGLAVFIEPKMIWQPIPYNTILKLEII